MDFLFEFRFNYLPGRSYPGIVCWYLPLYPDSHGGPFLCKHFHRMIAPSASGRPEKIGGAHINRRSIFAWGCSCTPCTPNSILVPTVFRIRYVDSMIKGFESYLNYLIDIILVNSVSRVIGVLLWGVKIS